MFFSDAAKVLQRIVTLLSEIGVHVMYSMAFFGYPAAFFTLNLMIYKSVCMYDVKQESNFPCIKPSFSNFGAFQTFCCLFGKQRAYAMYRQSSSFYFNVVKM